MRLFIVAGLAFGSLLSNTSPSASQPLPVATQELIREMGRASVFSMDCPALDIDADLLQQKVIAVGIDPMKLTDPNDRAGIIFKEAVRSAVRDLSSTSVMARCILAETLYGDSGSKLAGLVKAKGQSSVQVAAAPQAQAPGQLHWSQKAASAQPVDVPPPVPAARRVAGTDLQLAPRKFIGQLIQLDKMRCFYADVQEFRCITSDRSSVAIFVPAIRPAATQARIEQECGTFAEMRTARCLFTIRLTPTKYDEDIVSGYQKRTVIGAADVEILPTEKRRR